MPPRLPESFPADSIELSGRSYRVSDVHLNVASEAAPADGSSLCLPPRRMHIHWFQRWGKTAVSAALIALLLTAAAAVLWAVGTRSGSADGSPTSTNAARATFVRRVAFGSCTQRGIGPNSIWDDAIIPAQPDAWLWLGDLAYMDIPVVDCYAAANKEHPDCNCERDFLHHPPHGCMSGDVANARAKARAIVDGDGYGRFLEYMCPGHLLAGSFPPDGGDAAVCPRAVLGVYDDHDFGWNNGNGRQLRNKNEIKQVFLDAIGEPRASVRRSSARGIYEWRVWNAETSSRSVDMILLDERYDRAPLPCHVRREFCEAGAGGSAHEQAWCAAFLGNGTVHDPGACCRRDEDVLLTWCAVPAHKMDGRYESACEPTSELFGTVNWALDDRGQLVEADPSNWRHVADESGFCEVLGKKQRRWLNEVLAAASAPVQVVGSASVLLGQPQAVNRAEDAPPFTGYCSGDDWDCYRPAQRNLLSRLAAAPGCVIVVTGDYHVADIKRIVPNEANVAYASHYGFTALKKPIYQVMASGMHPSTARGLNQECGAGCCGWQRDTAGLRGPGKQCAVYGDPNFGVLDFDWDARSVTMRVMRGDGGGVAAGADGAPIQLTISIDTCEPL